MKQACPIFSHAILVGERRKYLGLLITLKVVKDPSTGKFTKNLSDEAVKLIKQKCNLRDIKTVDDV